MDNIYIVMVQKDGCTEQDILSFDKLKFKHKVIFTAKDMPNIVRHIIFSEVKKTRVM